MAGVGVHLLRDQVLGLVELHRGATPGVVLGSGGACGWDLDLLLATGRSLGRLPLLLLQLELRLYTAQVVELLLLYASLLLLALRREDALVVVDHLDLVLILLRHADGNAHVVRRQQALILDREAVGHPDRSHARWTQIDVHVG